MLGRISEQGLMSGEDKLARLCTLAYSLHGGLCRLNQQEPVRLASRQGWKGRLG